MKTMLSKRKFFFALLSLVLYQVFGFAQLNTPSGNVHWKIHDMSRPKPPILLPPEQTLPMTPPAGAIILFDGHDFSHWTSNKNTAPKWKLEKEYMEIVPGSGDILSTEKFGDVYLHVEWASPDEPDRRGQDRGNSGIFFMGMYELQVLDSYQADTYADGQAGALYGQMPPRFNVCRPRGEWNAYDISFRRPRFSAGGILLSPARITVVQNGILIQDNEEYLGPTSWLEYLPYISHPDRLPISLQDHNGKVRFRNIWAYPLPEPALRDKDYVQQTFHISDKDLDKYCGIYKRPNTTATIIITKKDGHLFGDFYYRPGALELEPVADREFVMKDTDGHLFFTTAAGGRVTDLVFRLGGEDMSAKKSE